MKNLVWLLILFPISLFAQINESDTLNVKADLSITGFWQDGNVQTEIFRASSDISIRLWKQSVFKTNNSYVYQEFGGKKADEDILSLNFLYFNPTRKVNPFLLGFISTNFRRRIDLRNLIGGGATFQVYDKDKNWLKFSVSGEYERTDFSTTNFNRSRYDGSSTIDTFRGTVWVSGQYHLVDGKMILGHESYFQPSLQERDNYRWKADLDLALPIWNFLNFTINYQHTFESIVVEDQKRQDRFLTFGFTVKSY